MTIRQLVLCLTILHQECAKFTKSLPIQEQCAQYWPESKNSPEKMGSQLSVELLSEGEFEDYICRELKITDLTVRFSKLMPSYIAFLLA